MTRSEVTSLSPALAIARVTAPGLIWRASCLRPRSQTGEPGCTRAPRGVMKYPTRQRAIVAALRRAREAAGVSQCQLSEKRSMSARCT